MTEMKRKIFDLELADSLEEELEFFISSFFGHYPTLYRRELSWRPPTDFFETESEYVVILEIAQIRAEEVSVTFHDGILSIRGNRKAVPPPERRRYHKMEIHYGPFEQKIAIPGEVDMENLSAHYRDGFLEIRLPKRRPPIGTVVDIKVE